MISPRSTLATLAILLLACLTAHGARRPPLLFALDAQSGVIHFFVIDPATGAPHPHAESPMPIPGGAAGIQGNSSALVADSKGRFLFAAAASGLAVFAIRADGLPQPVAGSPFGNTGQLSALAVWGRGKRSFIYACDMQNSRVHAFAFDSNTGMPRLIDTLEPSGAFGGHVDLCTTKRHLLLLNRGDRTVQAFPLDRRSGRILPALHPPQALPGALDPSGIAVDPKGRYLLANDRSQGRLLLATLDRRTGVPGGFETIATASGSSYAVGFDRRGKYLFGLSGPHIQVFDRNRTLVASQRSFHSLDCGAVSYRGEHIYLGAARDLYHYRIEIGSRMARLVSATVHQGLQAAPLTSLLVLR